MEIPSVKGYGDFEVEEFDQYYSRWPNSLKSFPKCLVESWVYRHWNDFEHYWLPMGSLHWNYEKRIFTNEMLLQIGHFKEKLELLDFWGSELFKNKNRRDTWLAKYMLLNGTSPAPILVLENSGGIIHPRGRPNEEMAQPFQLIEGHMRMAYLRGMLTNKYEKLKQKHEVWVATIVT